MDKSGHARAVVEPDPHFEDPRVREGHRVAGEYAGLRDGRPDVVHYPRERARKQVAGYGGALAAMDPRNVGFINLRHGVHRIGLAQRHKTVQTHFLAGISLDRDDSTGGRRPDHRRSEVEARAFVFRRGHRQLRLSDVYILGADLRNGPELLLRLFELLLVCLNDEAAAVKLRGRHVGLLLKNLKAVISGARVLERRLDFRNDRLLCGDIGFAGARFHFSQARPREIHPRSGEAGGGFQLLPAVQNRQQLAPAHQIAGLDFQVQHPLRPALKIRRCHLHDAILRLNGAEAAHCPVLRCGTRRGRFFLASGCEGGDAPPKHRPNNKSDEPAEEDREGEPFHYAHFFCGLNLSAWLIVQIMFACPLRPSNKFRLQRLAGFSLLFLAAVNCPAQSNPPREPEMDLSIDKAIEIATSPGGDASVQLARQTEQLNAASFREARSTLLPSFDGSAAEQNQTVNPKALGLRFSNPAFTIPDSVGPYSTYDVRLHMNLNLLDLSAIRRRRAAEESVQAARSETQSVRARVGVSVARLYLAALEADERAEVAKVNLEDAEALLKLASHRAAAGEGADIEVARANLSAARARQRVIEAQTESTRTHLELIKALHLNWDTNLRLTSTPGAPRADGANIPESVAVALKSRADLSVEQQRIASALLSRSAADSLRRPSLVAYGDVGVLQGVETHTIGASLRVPLFDGGRIRSEQQRAESLLQQEQIREKDLRSQVELEVREALAARDLARQQVQVAEQAVALAEEEMGRARRRYEAGLANSLEVIDANTQLGVARYDRLAALFNYSSAGIDLAQATGTAASKAF